MSYLVYCPTCDGKMSVNAEVCPHCGETDFFENVQNPYTIKTRCTYCNGEGVVWKHTIHGLPAVTTEFPAKTNDIVRTVHIINGRYDNIGIRLKINELSEEMRKILDRCIKFGDYNCIPMKWWTCDVECDEDICPKCKGEGKIDERRMGVKRIDIRKPVV